MIDGQNAFADLLFVFGFGRAVRGRASGVIGCQVEQVVFVADRIGHKQALSVAAENTVNSAVARSDEITLAAILSLLLGPLGEQRMAEHFVAYDRSVPQQVVQARRDVGGKCDRLRADGQPLPERGGQANDQRYPNDLGIDGVRMSPASLFSERIAVVRS